MKIITTSKTTIFKFKIIALKIKTPVLQWYNLHALQLNHDGLCFAWCGCTSEELLLPYISPNSTVLDVGSGSGMISARMRDEVPCFVQALEPGLEKSNGLIANAFLSSVFFLGNANVAKFTLQEAVKRDRYFMAFDYVTVFKYNVGMRFLNLPHTSFFGIDEQEQHSFCASLALAVKPQGTVYVHSVERMRCHFTPQYPTFYLPDILKQYFYTVKVETRISNQHCADGIITCRYPKISC